MNNNISTTMPSFKGIYVVKCPKGRDAKKYEKMMKDFLSLNNQLYANSLTDVFEPYAHRYKELNKTPNLIDSIKSAFSKQHRQLSEKNKNTNRLWDLITVYLTGYYGEDQPLVQMLVATNDDTDIVHDYHTKIQPSWLWTLADRILGTKTPDGDARIEKGKSELLAEVKEELDEYKYAIQGDAPDALLDFIEKTNNKANSRLTDIQSLTDKIIPTFDYNEIMTLMEKGMLFDPVDGIKIVEKHND